MINKGFSSSPKWKYLTRIKDNRFLMYKFKFNDHENYLFSLKYSSFIKNEHNNILVFLKDQKNKITYSLIEECDNQVVGYYDVKYYDYLPTKDELMLLTKDFEYKTELLRNSKKCEPKKKMVIFSSDYILNEISEYELSEIDLEILLIERKTLSIRYEFKNNEWISGF